MEKKLEELTRAEELITGDLMESASELVETLSKSFNSRNNMQEENMEVAEQERESNRKYDLELSKLNTIGEKYMNTLEAITNILVNNIQLIEPFTEIKKSNYGLRKDLQLAMAHHSNKKSEDDGMSIE